MNFGFLPTLPLTFSYPLLFGALLVAGMIGGEIARSLRLPRILGYMLVGFIIAPAAQAMGMALLIDEARIFVNLALGLVLFDLGRRLDLKWMQRDWTLAASGLAESALAFGAVFATLVAFGFPMVEAGLAGAIAMTTSPAVLLLMVHDTRAEGQVTERAMNLVALNGLLASIITTMMVASSHLAVSTEVELAILHPLYLFFGALILGGAMAWIARWLARSFERTRDIHFTLIVGMVVCAVGLATMLKVPVILALLAFGVFSRNDERSFDLLNVNLAPMGRLLYIVLFVITGASLPLSALPAAGAMGFALVLARAAGKFTGILAIAPIGGLRVPQAVGLGAVMLPMSSLSLLMAHDIGKIFPQFAHDLGAMFVAAIIIMEVLGPLAVQWGLKHAGETLPADFGATTMPPRGSKVPHPR